MQPEQFAQLQLYAFLTYTLFMLLLVALLITTVFLNYQIKKYHMATEQQFQQVLSRIDATTDEIAAEIKSLRDQLAGQGLPQDVEERLLAGFTAVADKLAGVGKEPVPPTEEEGGSGTATGSGEPSPNTETAPSA